MLSVGTPNPNGSLYHCISDKQPHIFLAVDFGLVERIGSYPEGFKAISITLVVRDVAVLNADRRR